MTSEKNNDAPCVAFNSEGYRKGAFAAIVGIVVNLFLTLFKLVAGIAGNSSAMIADAVHSASDVVSSVVVWVGMKVAAKPADGDHPWGHGKAEALAAKIVAIILILVGLKLLYEAIIGISEQEFQEVGNIALIAAVISIIAKELNFQYVYWLGKKLDSISLKADAWHHRSDAISSLVALAGIALSIYGGEKFWFADKAAAGIVAIIIIFVGWKFFIQAAEVLMDRQVPERELAPLREAILSTPGVQSIETLAARRSGLGLLVDVHIEVAADISVFAGHEIARQVRKDLIRKCPEVQNVLVHVEPAGEII